MRVEVIFIDERRNKIFKIVVILIDPFGFTKMNFLSHHFIEEEESERNGAE